MKLKGSVEIRVIDSRTGELKQTIEQDNLITNVAHSWLLNWSVRGIFNGFAISGNGYDTQIFISSSQATPSISSIPSGILATTYVPTGVTKATFNSTANPIFGQLQGRIDFTGTARTFHTVGLRELRDNSIHAYLLLDTPCVQGAFDYLDIFYRIQFVNTLGQGLPKQALIDFGLASFGFGSYDMSYYWASACTTPSDSYPYELFNFAEDLGTSFDSFFNRVNNGPISGARIDNHSKFRMSINYDINAVVGLIFNSIMQGRSGTNKGIYTCKKIENPSSPFQNLFSHSSNATVPFFDSLRLASGNGKTILGGSWTNKWPELYKITITDNGATGVSKYKWSVRRHLGFNGNTYSDRSIGCAFRNPNTPAFEKCHGWRDENNDVLRYSSTQVVQYDPTGVTLLDLMDGSYQNWDTTTSPGMFLVSEIRQCATDGSKIYVACRLTGLWIIDVVANLVTHPITAPCFGVDIGRNGVAYTIADGALSCSTDWAAPLPFTYAGVTDNNWNRVQFIKCDPEHPEDRLALVMTVPNTSNRRVVWHRLIAPILSTGEFRYESVADSNGVCYWTGTNYGVEAWTNPHTAGRATVVMSTVSQGTHAFMVNRQAGQNNHTGNIANSWIALDLGAGNTLLPNYYILQHRGTGGGYAIRNWKLQGSNNAASNSVADLNAATWVDLDVRVNDTTMSDISDYWAGYTAVANTGYRWLRIFQTGVNSSGDHHLILGEFEFYGTFNSTTLARIPPSGRLLNQTVTGVESTSIKSFAASLDVSDAGSFWVSGAGKLAYGGSVASALGTTLASQQLTHSIFGSDRYYKVAFYKNFLIGQSQVINDAGVVQNTVYASFGDKSFILHMDGSIVITNRELRVLFTSNDLFVYDNYGWNGTAWELNASAAKTTHAAEQPLLNGITVKFEDAVNAPHFTATDYYTQGVCNGVLKDNATTIYSESAWYSKPAQFNYPVQAGAIVPATPIVAATTAKYWRVRSRVPATGFDRRWYVRELIFRDSAGTDITSGGSVSVSYPDSVTYLPIYATDKSVGGQFSRVSDQELGWIAYTFATEVTVAQVSISHHSSSSNTAPTSYVVESSTDGNIWLGLWNFTTGTADGTYYNSTYNPPTNSAPGKYLLKLSATDDPNFIRIETDSVELTKLTINGVAPATTYTTEPIAIGPNEVYVDGEGALYFNSAQAGAAIAGTYAYVKN